MSLQATVAKVRQQSSKKAAKNVTRHRLFHITPVDKKRIECHINWLDLETRQFGVTFLEGKYYKGESDVIDMDDRESYELVEV